MSVIEVHGLSKTYRRVRRPPQKAVVDLDLVVEEGGVHGFLGPNGSGKTTTIRMLLGLVHADAGEMRLFGKPVPQALPETLQSVGALVESPVFFPQFSGRRNLELLAGVAGLPERRVGEVLETVGLADRGRDRVKAYSLGMRQRLGIAAALLKEPRLLVLDEPSNGLDPAGIREVRELLRRLGGSGVTVFVSSHLLAEVEQMCDSVDILAKGRRIASGKVSDVLASRETGEIRVRVGNLASGEKALAAAGLGVRRLEDQLIVTGATDPSQITKTLAAKRLYVSELTPLTRSLESVFLELTEDAPVEPTA